jgi:hypothetical protein
MKHMISLVLTSLLGASFAPAQDPDEGSIKGGLEQKGRDHRIAAGIGHTFALHGTEEGGKELLGLPTWSFDYDYTLSAQWGLGLQCELIAESFIVKKTDGTEVVREWPIALMPVALFRVNRWLSVLGGGGVELAPESNVAMSRLGFEAGWEFESVWEVNIAVFWDNKFKTYDSFSLCMSIGHLFGG